MVDPFGTGPVGLTEYTLFAWSCVVAALPCETSATIPSCCSLSRAWSAVRPRKSLSVICTVLLVGVGFGDGEDGWDVGVVAGGEVAGAAFGWATRVMIVPMSTSARSAMRAMSGHVQRLRLRSSTAVVDSSSTTGATAVAGSTVVACVGAAGDCMR